MCNWQVEVSVSGCTVQYVLKEELEPVAQSWPLTADRWPPDRSHSFIASAILNKLKKFVQINTNVLKDTTTQKQNNLHRVKI